MEIKNREKFLAIAVGAAILFFWLGDVVVIKPMIRSWNNRSDRIAQLRKQLNDDQQLLARGPQLLSRWSNMQSNSLSSSPAQAESQLFNSFDTWVRSSGVTQGSFHPQVRDTDQNYSVLECRADVTGNMQQIFDFLYNLEKDPIAIRLDTVGLTSRDDNGRQLALVLEMSGLMLPSQQQ